jgi:hypothetical protein
MTPQREPAGPSQADRNFASEHPLNRRRALRLLGSLAAAAAGAAVLSTSQPQDVRADGSEGSTTFTATDGVAVLGLNNSATYATIAGENSGSTVGVYGSSNGGQGVYGTSSGPRSAGVYGSSDGAIGAHKRQAGVYGVGPAGFQGVYGECLGVAGINGSYGVFGDSDVGVGVRGLGDLNGSTGVYGTSGGAEAPAGYYAGVLGSAPTGTTAVQGVANNPGPIPPQGTAGVGGTSDAGYGVVGTSTSNYGVLGISVANAGVVGFSPAATGVGGGTASGIGFGGVASSTGNGVQGQAVSGGGVVGATTGSGPAIVGIPLGGGLAGDFRGPVNITGPLTVMGQNVKSAAVRGSSGRLVRLYSLECPESWFEDFGTAQLTGGSATVHLEPEFAGVVKTDQYRVFPVPKGDCKGLYIGSQSPSSFTVHELQSGTSNVSFDYRVVAKRKDIEGARLEHVDEPPAVPLLKLPELPTIPPPLPTPAMPTPPGHGG